jgi:CheY-like chemotaxis protein
MNTTSKPRELSSCYHCRTSFDPTRSRWCDCLSKLRSLVCTTCQRCSCGAPPEWARIYGIRMPRPERLYRTPEGGGAKPVALVAEDQRIVRTMICATLAPHFEVFVAETGTRALELARQLLPALVVTDALMPGLDGREMARMIKSDPLTASTKIILVTGLYKSVRHANEAILVFKVDAVLPKPLSAKALLAEVDRLLSTPATAQSA